MPFFSDTGTSALRAKSFNIGSTGMGLPVGNPFAIQEEEPQQPFTVPGFPTTNISAPYSQTFSPAGRGEAPSSGLQSWVTGAYQPPVGTTPAEQGQAAAQYGQTGFTPGLPGGIQGAQTGVQTRDLVTDYFQAQYDKWYAGLHGQLDAARAQAKPGISALEEQLGVLKGADVNPLFRDYYESRDEIGAALPATPLAPSNAPEVVDKQYDDAEGELKEAFKQMDMKMGKDVVNGMVKDMRTYEGVTEDMLRTDLASIGKVHDLNARVADATAKAAYSTDILKAKEAQGRINAELDFKTDQTAKALEREKAALAAQLKAIRDANPFEAQDLVIEDVIKARWAEMMSQRGYSAHDVQSANDIWAVLEGDASSMTSETNFRHSMTSAINESNLERFGLSMEDYTSYIDEKVAMVIAQAAERGQVMTDAQAQGIVAGYERNLNRFMTTADLGKWIQKPQAYADDFVDQLLAAGVSRPQAIGMWNQMLQSPDKVASTTGVEAQILRNMYTTQQYVYDNWDQISASYGPQINAEDVYMNGGGAFPIVGGGQYSNDWGNPRSGGRSHEGTDIFAARGTPIVATTSGKVLDIDEGELGGLYVKIKALDGSVHYYAHMDSQASNLKVGQRVYQGRTYLGNVGNTGNARTTPPHLHYGVYRNGHAVNPYPWLSSIWGG